MEYNKHNDEHNYIIIRGGLKLAQIIHLDKYLAREQPIDVEAIRANARKLKAGLIAPATEEVDYEIAAEHTSEPIKSMEDINRISKYLIDNKRY